MYATTTTGHREHVTGSKGSKVAAQLLVWNSVAGVIIQDTDTITEEWYGLSYEDALTLYEASETSTLNGTTRPYLGNALLSQTTTPGAYVRATSCWGTQVTTQFTRMGDTNLYHVTKTTV